MLSIHFQSISVIPYLTNQMVNIWEQGPYFCDSVQPEYSASSVNICALNITFCVLNSVRRAFLYPQPVGVRANL